VTTTRRITFEGPINFRDLGGYETADGRSIRWGRLFRSDSLHTVTAADVPLLRELGIRTAIDFRSGDEISRLGIGPLGEVSVAHVHCPTFDTATGEAADAAAQLPFDMSSAAAFYEQMMSRGSGAYVAALDSIVRADSLPAVFYCLAGKDRTGCFAAVVLGLLGVPDDTIVTDYALTQEVVPLLTERRIQRDGAEVESTRWTNVPEDLKAAHAHTMEGLIERVHARWHDWDGYAAAVGVPDDVVARLRDALLEP
jgi:protein-tyrosine phosphatase